ncbi:MAG TPA: fructose bisphosphate aldolase [Tissierellaceae bacterium]|nr:fructose bisphosphate aldolase [Tissierellaceae bacterium]
MDNEKMDIIKNNNGFIAALDQSGGSTPKALKMYGVPEDSYNGEEEMFDMIHDMRTRIITNQYFNNEKIIGAILFEQTIDRKIDGLYIGDYLWNEKGIVPFLKVDQGLAREENGVQLMNPLTNLDQLLKRAKERNIFGTKMRSLIKTVDPKGIKDIVDQQFEIGQKIYDAGLIPILEPEVDINSPTKSESETIMKEEILKHLNKLDRDIKFMFKLSIPSKDNFFKEIIDHERVLRVVALSGGYTRENANKKLGKNPKLIASFSRALTEGLSIDQNDEEFNNTMKDSVDKIYKASIK